MSPADLAKRIAALDWSGVPLLHQLAVVAVLETLKEIPVQTNIITLPVRPRTCWTTLCHLDGREWLRSSHFGPSGAWSWIVESVAAEHGVSEDAVGCAESDDYDGDDLVTVDGLPVYRINHYANKC